ARKLDFYVLQSYLRLQDIVVCRHPLVQQLLRVGQMRLCLGDTLVDGLPLRLCPGEAPVCLRDGISEIQPAPSEVAPAGVSERLRLFDGARNPLPGEK